MFGHDVSLLFNDGSGSLGPATSVPVSGEPRAVAIGDLDGDGDRDDVLGSHATSPTRWILPNQGAGEFAAPVSTGSLTIFPDAVRIADLDGDGDQDILTGSAASGFLAVSRNAGDGTFDDNEGGPSFGEPVTWSIGTSTQPGGVLRMADFDRDGWLDLAVAPFLSNPVVPVLLSDGAGGFRPVAHYDVAAAPSEIAVTDLDGDADLDLVVSCKDADLVAVLRNQTPPAVSATLGRDDAGAFGLSRPRPNPRAGRDRDRIPAAATGTCHALGARRRRPARRVLVDAVRPAGEHVARWDGRSSDGSPVPAGVYFVRLRAGDLARSERIVLVRNRMARSSRSAPMDRSALMHRTEKVPRAGFGVGFRRSKAHLLYRTRVIFATRRSEPADILAK